MKSILKIKIAHVIGVNGLLEQCRCEHEEMSLWQDVGNNWWSWDQIVETAENVTIEEVIKGMEVDGQVTNSSVNDILNLISQEDPFYRAAFN